MSRFFLLSAAVISLFLLAAQRPPALDPVEAKVNALLARMSIEDKVGQMTEVAIDVVSAGNATGLNHRLDAAKLRDAIQKYRVGSILNVNGEAYSVDHWHEVLNAIQDEVEKTKLKIPVIYGIDSIHGANYTRNAVLFPQSISVAAAWNPALARRAGEISAFQTRASGIPWSYFPVMDIGRQPAWPRFWETFGEDPLLASRLGAAYIEGLQGNDYGAPDKAAACVKHYAGYSMPVNGKDRTPAILDERTLRQVILPPYEAAVRAGAPTVMVNSGEISGVPGHANHHLLTEILKQEWGFKGFVVSDWEDIKRLHTRDRVAATPKDAVRMAVMAGVDMSMVPMDYSFFDLLLACVKDGSVPVSRIDDAVRRILRVKFKAGLFDRPRPDAALKARFDQPAFHEANLEAARESLVLLKNEGVLPLAKGRKVFVTGPNAHSRSALNGGWTITWQGDQEQLYPRDKATIAEAIARVGGTALVNSPAAADVVVAVLGEKAYCETPGNIEDLALDPAQVRLVEDLKTTGKPVVTVLVEGRPRVLRSVRANSAAILLAMLPGAEGGRAVAEVLFGDVNPSGRLPFTYPRNVNGYTTYDYKPLEDTHDNPAAAEYPFGFGLSYTKYEYSGLRLAADTMARNGSITISVNVKNTGSRAGKEVVQLYVSDLYREVSPPNRELKAFEKISLQPGETRAVSFTLKPADLQFVGLNNKWKVEPGDFKVRVAGLEQQFSLK